MATTNYDTVNGRLRGEVSSGVRTGYLTDALGSVTATVQAAAVVNTYRYKPYGSQLAKNGAGADPRFLYLGSIGISQNIFGTLAIGRSVWGTFSAISYSADLLHDGASGRAYLPLGDPRAALNCDLKNVKSYAVPYDTVQPFIERMDVCGVWGQWRIKFALQKLRNLIGQGVEGYIIQHITYPDKVSNHCETFRPPPKPLAGFFEVWYFNRSDQLLAFGDFTDVTAYPAHDSWATGVPPTYNCHRGTTVIKGQLKFYQADRKCAAKWGYVPGGLTDPRRDLVGGPNPPMGWTPGGVQREASSSFDCCKRLHGWYCGFPTYLDKCDPKVGSFPICKPLSV